MVTLTRRSSLRVLAVVATAATLTPLAAPAYAEERLPLGYGDAAVSTATVIVPMTFPVLGPTSYSDTYLACRSGCTRRHFGQDLMGPKMRIAVATFNGVIWNVKRERTIGEGNYLTIKGDNGWSANYIHMNNDRPGTDDGRGTASYFTAPGIYEGKRVFAGEILGWVGDSGNAESTGPHLHFELRKGDPWSGTVYNAFSSLNHARRLSAPTTSGPHPQGSFVKGCATTCTIWQLDNGKRRQLLAEVAKEWAFDARSVIPVTANEARWYPQGPRVQLPPGRAYKGADGKTWLVGNGVRYLVPDDAALALLGIAKSRVRTMTDAGLRTVPVAPSWATLPTNVVYDGALYRQPEAGKYWYVTKGVRRAVTDAFTLKSWGLVDADAITLPVPPETPEAPEDGEDMGEGDLPPVVEELVLPPLGAPLFIRDGAVVRSSTTGRRYLVSNGTRRWFGSYQLYTSYAYNKALVHTPPSAAMSRMPGGPVLP